MWIKPTELKQGDVLSARGSMRVAATMLQRDAGERVADGAIVNGRPLPRGTDVWVENR